MPTTGTPRASVAGGGDGTTGANMGAKIDAAAVTVAPLGAAGLNH